MLGADDTYLCETCKHYLGGGDCEISLEAECGKGYHEAYEPILSTGAHILRKLTKFGNSEL